MRDAQTIRRFITSFYLATLLVALTIKTAIVFRQQVQHASSNAKTLSQKALGAASDLLYPGVNGLLHQ